MKTNIKQELYSLIDNCDNEILLTEAKVLLESTENDWWNDLNEIDKTLLINSEIHYEKGNYISHKKLIQEIKERIKK
ncbi:MAG: hypothetical protein ABI366_09940 [Ginsengibacter sp.]